MARTSSPLTLGFAFLLTCSLAGCGDNLVSVGGTATLDGEKMTKGSVTFHPVGEGPLGQGQIQSDGTFTISTASKEGLPPGKYKVTVVATEDPPPAPEGPGAVEVAPKSLLPPKYGNPKTTDIEFDIPSSGAKDLEIKLTSG
jgi:hypothetical protein